MTFLFALFLLVISAIAVAMMKSASRIVQHGKNQPAKSLLVPIIVLMLASVLAISQLFVVVPAGNVEKQEAQRKQIEARGISDFQNIVSQGISEPLLRWKGIEATEKLAGSSNTKVIVIGAGKDGLPLILDTK
jgi:type II secretory pathway component PulK